MWLRFLLVTLSLILAAFAFAQQKESPLEAAPLSVDLKSQVLHNLTAYISPQCYTKTEDAAQKVHNPCYTCHTRSQEPNYINDADLQMAYSFPDENLDNPWSNLFEDRTQRVAAISDQAILEYIRQDNYFDINGDIQLVAKLATLPAAWDVNDNGKWDGYTPDCYFNFDQEGFDRNPQGKPTGWRAFAYYPFPASHWPTNGASGDVLIRLPAVFRQDSEGRFDLEVYKTNLAIVEALINWRDISIAPTDETRFGVDLNRDGHLATATTIVFDWAPLKGRDMAYVGQAGRLQKEGKLSLAAGLFPLGTEFLRSQRYLDIAADGTIALSPRMREVRYMQKRTWQTYSDLEEDALGEMKERKDFPSRTAQFIGNSEMGVYNGSGWLLQGFIEDVQGHLRPQSFEETVFCMGCHGGLGVTTDSIFAFARKLDGTQYKRGWFHWGQKSLVGIKEPKVKIGKAGVFYEYSTYLMCNRSGSEFRDNTEVDRKFFHADGTVKKNQLKRLHDDIAHLIMPSPQRALTLNKAYRTIVEDQDFILGREANFKPLEEVHQAVKADQPTGIMNPLGSKRFGARSGVILDCGDTL